MYPTNNKETQEIKELSEKLAELKKKNKKPTLDLEAIENKEGVKVGVRKNGRKYLVRSNRDRFFFPGEWNKFFETIRESQKATFDTLMQTGARINETIHIKMGDVDFDAKRVILRVTKIKAKKGEKNPRPRTISLSSQFTKRLKKYTKGKSNEDYIGLLSAAAAHIAMKKGLQKAGIKDWYMFSLHNVRKTHGNYLKALGKDGAEICTRLGHDQNTFLKSYSSPDIFSDEELRKIRIILGDLYERRM